MGSTVSVILGLVLAVLVLVLFTVKLKIHPFFALIATSATFAIVAGMNMQDMLSAFTSGMGGTIADIGLVIALGTVTGTLLEKSGAAETMAKTILKITGKKHAALGLAITGYFVSIPVFCDSAFVLLSPIARRLSKDTKISMTTMAISLAMGLHATHMFVPPTPGPLAVAGILNADLGMVILFGALVSIPVMLVGYFASLTAGKKYYYIPEDDSDVTEEEDENAKLPSALASFMPILVPILLMLLKTVGDMVASENILLSILNVIGTPAVALLIGMLLAAYTYHNIHPEDKLAWSFDGLVADSLRTAGQIVLIVGAGGAFGGVLKASAMQSVLTDAFSGLTIGILAPFLIGFIFYRGFPGVTWDFLSGTSSYIKDTIGILPNILNTLYIVLLAMTLVLPLGVGAAIYLTEYAANRRVVELIEFATETLTGIPSIIFGLVGMLFFVQKMDLQAGVLAGSLTLVVMILPTIVRTTQESLKTVPQSYREGALALGAGKWRMVRTVVLPNAVDGIVTGCILAVGRIVGESAALLYTAGFGLVLNDFVTALHSSSATLTVALYVYANDRGRTDVAFSIASVLMLLTLVINLTAALTGRKLKKNGGTQ